MEAEGWWRGGDATCPITRHVLARSHRSGAKLLDFTFCPRRAEMDAHVLKTLLQIHLASDASATLHVPYILATLKPEHLAPTSHLPKWTNRIHSLLHSKEPGGRWAGLSLAIASARLSRSLEAAERKGAMVSGEGGPSAGGYSARSSMSSLGAKVPEVVSGKCILERPCRVTWYTRCEDLEIGLTTRTTRAAVPHG